MSRVLVIGDVHEPATHPGYRAFCESVASKWQTERVVFIGDLVDMHQASFHAAEPEAAGAEHEAEQAYERVQTWYETWPRAEVMIGNHDARAHRLASSVRVPPRFIRDYSKVWGTTGWRWKMDTTIDRVHYLHGTGCGGQTPALNAARISMTPTVCGHVHSAGGVHVAQGPQGRPIWGMDTGCGVDVEHAAMRYGRDLLRKPVLSAGVVIDGHPYFELMDWQRGGRFHRSRFRGSA